MKSNFDQTAEWLWACGKTPGDRAALSVQIGCHIEEFLEFLGAIEADADLNREMRGCIDKLELIAGLFKSGLAYARIANHEAALDALCDSEVTGNGVAFLARYNKNGADNAVLASNEAKLVNGKPVILPGGKIGKPPGWKAPNLKPFIKG